MSFLTVAAPVELEEVIKGSRFLAFVARAQSVNAATAFLEEVRSNHPDATHHAFAYRIGQEYRFSDDGEPGGTAGRPMLEVLTRRDLDEVVAVVTRYYGGTRLGTGGLVRAYGGTLAKALDRTRIEGIKPRINVALHVPFADMDTVHRLLGGWPELEKGEPDYDASGLRLHVTLNREEQESFEAALTEETSGAAQVTKL